MLSTEILQELSELSNLSVHFLGAECMVECLALIKYEEIFHSIPTLNHLTLTFIGPFAFQNSSHEILCETCLDKNRKVDFQYYRGMYQHYAASKEYYRPDIVVAFNSGIHEDWEKDPTKSGTQNKK